MSYMVKNIQRIVEKEAGLAPGACTSRRRSTEYVQSRWVALRLCRTFLPHTTCSELGHWFNKDHTTILHALKNAEHRKIDSTELYQRCEPLVERALNASSIPESFKLQVSAKPTGYVSEEV